MILADIVQIWMLVDSHWLSTMWLVSQVISRTAMIYYNQYV